MSNPIFERVPAELLALSQAGDSYSATFGLEDDGRSIVTFTASTVPELVSYLVYLRYALGRDVW